MKKLLCIFAHPDDESFAAGGTIAKYVKLGWNVDVVCATKGEAGNGDVYNVKGDALGVVRWNELEKAAGILGVASVRCLGLKDGTLVQQNPGEIEELIYKHIEAILPDVVVTFDTLGISNHPDHVRLSYSATFAYQRYATWLPVMYDKSTLYIKHDEQWLSRFEKFRVVRMEPKLYYVCMPKSVVEYAKKQKIIPTESYGKPWQGTPDKRITTIIDIAEYMSVKLEALKCHQSQITDVDRFLQTEGNPQFDHEYFMQRMVGTAEVYMGKNDGVSDAL